MAEVADLQLLPLEEANEDPVTQRSETLDPAPFTSSAPDIHRATVPDLLFSFSPPSRRIRSNLYDLMQFEQDSDQESEYPDAQMSLALDLFDHCPPLPQRRVEFFPEFPGNSVFEVAEEMCPSDLGLGLDFGSGIESRDYGDGGGDQGAVSDWGADAFFLGRRSSVSESIEFSRACPVDDDGLRIVGFESDSDSDEQIVAIGADLESSGAQDQITDDAGLPLCWDCLRLEDDDRRDPIEEFEWEEVDARLEDREVLSMMVVANEEGSNVSRELGSGGVEQEEEGTRNIEWEVLTVNNLGRNPMDPEELESYFVDDHEGFVYTSEYEILIGQFADHDSSLKGGPPAAKSAVENLPSVVLTKEDIADNVTCAVCKDEISIEEAVKRLPCSHHYHKECILPWLGIRNTCPLCRFELPTDDPEYEKWKARRAGSRVSEEESRVRYDFEILHEA